MAKIWEYLRELGRKPSSIRTSESNLIINDVSERKRDEQLIREFAGEAYRKDFRIVNASEIRRKVFKHLGRQPRFDLILTGDRGGTLLFTDRQLLRFGKRIVRIPYSIHRFYEWEPLVRKEVSRLGAKPRVLVLESDVGPTTHTVGKLERVKGAITLANENAKVHIVAGAASGLLKPMPLNYVALDYVAYVARERPVRLSELVEKYRLPGELQSRMFKMRERKAMHTGTLPH